MIGSCRIPRTATVLVLAGLMTCAGLGAVADATVPSGADTATVTAGDTRAGVDASLHPAGAIEGVVTYGSNRSRVAKVFVAAFDGHRRIVASDATDSKGIYHLYDLYPGRYRVCAFGHQVGHGWRFGLAPRCVGTGAPPPGESPPWSAKRTPVVINNVTEQNFRLRQAGGIRGTVRSRSGRALQQVNVTTYYHGRKTAQALSDSDGRYRIDMVVPGKYKVCFSLYANRPTGGSTGVLPQCYRHTQRHHAGLPADAKPVRVRSDHATQEINGRLHRAGAIAGQVVTAGGHHDLLDGSVVRVFDGRRLVGTDATTGSGKYVVGGLFGGKYKICARGGQNLTAVATGHDCRRVSVTERKTHRHVRLKLPTTEPPSGRVSGTLTDSGGVGLGGARVFLFKGDAPYFGDTEDDGRYSFAQVPAGTYRVCFDTSAAQPTTGSPPPVGYSDVCSGDVPWPGAGSPAPGAAAKFTVTPHSETTGADAKAGDAGAIAGTVGASDGTSPVVDVYLFDSAGNPLDRTQVVRSGPYSIGRVSPGRYIVCFDADTGGSLTPTNGVGYLPQCFRDVDWHEKPCDVQRCAAAAAQALVDHRQAGSARSGVIHN